MYIVVIHRLITYPGSYSPVKGLQSVVSYDKKIIINNRINLSDYGVSIISKWALNNGPDSRVHIPIQYNSWMAADVFYYGT